MNQADLERYRNDPAAWAGEVLGEDFKLTPYQKDLLDYLVSGMDVAGVADRTAWTQVRRAFRPGGKIGSEARFWAEFRDWPLPVSSARFPRFARYLKRHRVRPLDRFTVLYSIPAMPDGREGLR